MLLGQCKVHHPSGAHHLAKVIHLQVRGAYRGYVSIHTLKIYL